MPRMRMVQGFPSYSLLPVLSVDSRLAPPWGWGSWRLTGWKDVLHLWNSAYLCRETNVNSSASCRLGTLQFTTYLHIHKWVWGWKFYFLLTDEKTVVWRAHVTLLVHTVNAKALNTLDFVYLRNFWSVNITSHHTASLRNLPRLHSLLLRPWSLFL